MGPVEGPGGGRARVRGPGRGRAFPGGRVHRAWPGRRGHDRAAAAARGWATRPGPAGRDGPFRPAGTFRRGRDGRSGHRPVTGARSPAIAASGLVIVDKPPRLTSHDVVGRIRRLAGTRRGRHAGTLDPMATGVLVSGVEEATRLLGHLALTEKEYSATIRLGQATGTDDADGEILAGTSAAGLSDAAPPAATPARTAALPQRPPASA